jgi:hypothetical protein
MLKSLSPKLTQRQQHIQMNCYLEMVPHDRGLVGKHMDSPVLTNPVI